MAATDDFRDEREMTSDKRILNRKIDALREAVERIARETQPYQGRVINLLETAWRKSDEDDDEND